VVEPDYSDLIPEQFAGMKITVREGPSVKTMTKGVPKQMFHEEPS
jgi:hypothetical protein